ncbi:MAG: E3 binding domain-containing protein, partial [Actinomycetota bacterium]|nr:E3 binding domain-containing protein [Actinomycetota bacterium]
MAYQFKLPDMGEGLTEAEVVRWLVQRGEEVRMDAPLVEVETDKAVVEIPSPRAGVLLDQGAAAGAVVKVGQVLAVIGEPGEQLEPFPSPVASATGQEVSPSPTTAREAAPRVQALPVVRKLAKDLGVDLARLQGSGPAGR